MCLCVAVPAEAFCHGQQTLDSKGFVKLCKRCCLLDPPPPIATVACALRDAQCRHGCCYRFCVGKVVNAGARGQRRVW